jgi:thiosulfate dehydrogenase [quinone] large subunit
MSIYLSNTTGGWLAVLRIYTGFFWAAKGYGKLMNPQWATPNGQMVQILQDMIKDSSGIYHDFVVNVVLTHVQLFGYLVAWGELLTGVSLLLGLLTVAGGIGGCFLALNYFAAKGSFTTLQSWATFDVMTALLSLSFAVLPARRFLALDPLVFKGRRR